MKKIWFLIVLVFSQMTLADFNSALDSYESGDYPQAYQKFKSMAELGDKRSQFNLGVMYFSGQHVAKDLNKAYAWIKLATKTENAIQSEIDAFKSISQEVTDKTAAEKEYNALSNLYSTEVLFEKLYPVLIKPENDAAFSAIPTKIIEPKYPRNAAIKGQQGWARYEFDIDKTGAPRNIQLISSGPKNLFVKESVKAIKKWRFKPGTDAQGNPVIDKKLRYTMEFRLNTKKNRGDVGISEKGGLSALEEAFKLTYDNAQKGDAFAQYQVGYWHKRYQDYGQKVNPNEWLMKAAAQDFPPAQFELGRNLLKGQGCIADKSKGIEWLTRSATSGHSGSKKYLASVATETVSKESHVNALRLYSEVEELDPHSKIDFAWLLATSPYAEVANPKRAIELVESLPRKLFWDKATKYEVTAAAYAALGNYKKAVDAQEDALSKARLMKVDDSDIKSRLAQYENNQKWF